MSQNELQETHLQGIPVSAGIGIGRLCLQTGTAAWTAGYPSLNSLPRAYHARLESALRDANLELLNLLGQCRNMGTDIFEALSAHTQILSDQSLQNWIGINMLEQFDDLEVAINQYVDAYRELLRACVEENSAERERLFKLLKQILRTLLGSPRAHLACRDTLGCQVGECVLQNDHVILCPEISPLSAITMDDHACGLLIASDTVDMDSSILLRGLRMPVVSGLKSAMNAVSTETDVLVNGYDGTVIINPAQSTIDQALACH